jgi:hypothetical protein
LEGVVRLRDKRFIEFSFADWACGCGMNRNQQRVLGVKHRCKLITG